MYLITTDFDLTTRAISDFSNSILIDLQKGITLLLIKFQHNYVVLKWFIYGQIFMLGFYLLKQLVEAIKNVILWLSWKGNRQIEKSGRRISS